MSTVKKQPRNVQKKECSAESSMNIGKLLTISIMVIAVGAVMSILPTFLMITEIQMSAITSLGVILVIFGIVMFGIMLSRYSKKLSDK